MGGVWLCERNHRRRLDEEATFKHLDQVVRNLQGIDGIISFDFLLFRNGRSWQDNQSGCMGNCISSLLAVSTISFSTPLVFPGSSTMINRWNTDLAVDPKPPARERLLRQSMCWYGRGDGSPYSHSMGIMMMQPRRRDGVMHQGGEGGEQREGAAYRG
uniref:uncharacterized protein LOC105352054 n=1 Tax=Fragaria vesca subsp. vesca TaxID=101020 RepID=UPI0005CAD3CA|nr:PREDICTED: uncharacterized protein LOC105352054 [Fragaria vesca subsp. vesca]